MTKKVIRCSKRVNRSYVKAADFDAEAFRARHKGAQERSAAKRKDKQDSIINQIKDAEDPIETAFELLVPSSGKADVVAGELVRAMMRILYRDWNDGDLFYEGYGIETCGDAVAFLCDKIPELEDDFEGIAMRQLNERRYTDAIKKISEKVIEHIFDNPDLVIEKNAEDMFDFDGEDFIRDREWEAKYNFECELPQNLYAHVEAGNISERDLQWELESWDYVRNGDVNVGSDYVSVYDLDRDSYDELESSMYGWLEQYGDDLDDEYGVPGEEEDEYDEEEEE